MEKNKIINDEILNEVSGGTEYWEDDFDPSYFTQADSIVLEGYIQNYIMDGLTYVQGYQKAFNEVYPLINKSHSSRNAPLVSEAFLRVVLTNSGKQTRERNRRILWQRRKCLMMSSLIQ